MPMLVNWNLRKIVKKGFRGQLELVSTANPLKTMYINICAQK
jgi:hypothetical protein